MSYRHESDPRVDLLLNIAEKALKTPRNDPDEPRSPVWLKCVGFAALIIGPAILLGLAFAFGDFIMQFTGDHRQRQQAEQSVQNDTPAAFKSRFITGAGIGGALGAICVVRRIVRKVDP